MSERTPEDIFAEYLAALGHDLDANAELQGTPQRFTTLLRDRFAADADALPELSPLPTRADRDGMVVIRDVHFHALCVHHITPFFGTFAFAFIPDESIVGFGALHDLVHAATRSPQLQEQLTERLAAHIQKTLKPRGLVVVSKARQMCMELTGTPPGALTVAMSCHGALSGEPGRTLAMQLVE